MIGGRSGAVFPEGKVGPGDRVLHFHARLFQTAKDAQVPVQPVTLDYRLRDGRHIDLPFRPNESFVPNIGRLLMLPTDSNVSAHSTLARSDHKNGSSGTQGSTIM